MKRTLLCSLGLLLAMGLGSCGGSSPASSPQHGAGTSSSSASQAPSRSIPKNATDVANGMARHGLPVTIIYTFTAENDPNHLLGRQNGYSSKVSLQDSRLPTGDPVNNSSTDGGAAIEFYPDEAGAAQRLSYLKAIGPPLGDGYDYLAGTAVLRLSDRLTPDQATQYNQAFTLAVAGD